MTEVRDATADEPADARAPDVAGVVVGWRSWTLAEGDDGPVLRSPVIGTAWPTGTALQARCRLGHRAPADACRCGLYAVRDVWTAIAAGGEILGCVALWGDVVEGEHGWRAGWAHPRLLIVGPDVPEAVRAGLVERYGVEVRTAGTSLYDVTRIVGIGTPGAEEFSRRADVLRDGLAGGTSVEGPTARLLDLMRPVGVPQSIWLTVGALVVLCAAPDVWTCAAVGTAAIDADRGGWRGVLAFVLFVVLLFSFFAICAALPSAVRSLKDSLRGALGRAGTALWWTLAAPTAAAVLVQPGTIAGLVDLGHRAWVPVLLLAPVLVTTLGLTAWIAGRSARVVGRPWPGAVVGLALATTAIVLCVDTTEATVLGEDVAFESRGTAYWNARIAENGPPGLCLNGREAFFSGSPSAVVECSEAHWGELAGFAPLGTSPAPPDDQIEARARFACGSLVAGEGLGGGAADDELAMTFLYSVDTWRDGGRTMDNYAACAVSRRDGTSLPPGSHVDPRRHAADQPVYLDLHGDRPGASAPIGLCVATAVSAADPRVHDAPVVTCDRPHWGEVLGYPMIGGPRAPWPGDDAVLGAAAAACASLGTSRGLPPDVTVDSEAPDQGFWNEMAPTGITAGCIAHRRDGVPVAGPWR